MFGKASSLRPFYTLRKYVKYLVNFADKHPPRVKTGKRIDETSDVIISLLFFSTGISHLFGSCFLPFTSEADGDLLRDSASTLGLQGGFLFQQAKSR